MGMMQRSEHPFHRESRRDRGRKLRITSLSIGTEIMLSWALSFLVLALIAAAFGFGGIAASAAGIAKILFFVFIVLFALSLISNLTNGRSPV